MIPVDQQCRCLETLKGDVELFGPHEIPVIRNYWKETGFHTDVISVFEKMRNAVKNRTRNFQAYEDMRSKFNVYIDARIQQLQESKAFHEMDPWMELSLSAGDRKVRDQLQEISNHIQDVLFTCELVIDYGLAEDVDLTKNELDDLNKKLVTLYYTQLRRKIGELETLSTDIAALETDVQHQNFTHAKEILQKIRQELKVSAVAARQRG